VGDGCSSLKSRSIHVAHRLRRRRQRGGRRRGGRARALRRHGGVLLGRARGLLGRARWPRCSLIEGARGQSGGGDIDEPLAVIAWADPSTLANADPEASRIALDILSTLPKDLATFRVHGGITKGSGRPPLGGLTTAAASGVIRERWPSRGSCRQPPYAGGSQHRVRPGAGDRRNRPRERAVRSRTPRNRRAREAAARRSLLVARSISGLDHGIRTRPGRRCTTGAAIQPGESQAGEGRRGRARPRDFTLRDLDRSSRRFARRRPRSKCRRRRRY